MRGASVFVAVIAILLGTGISPSVARTSAQVPAVLGPGNVLFGYEASAAAARIITYDLSQTPAIPIAACVPTPSINGRGLAFDPSDLNLWYTFVSSAPPFTGDGMIHKTSPTCGAVTPAAITVSGALQSDFGALDMDPTDPNFIWVAGYQPVANTATVSGNCATTSTTCSYYYKVRKSDGVVVKTCKTEFQGGGAGNDSLTVGDFGSGLKLLTDAAEIASTPPTPNNLLVVDPGSCATESMIPKSVGMTGIDFEMGSLFVTDSKVLYQLGGPPFSTVTPLGLTGTPFELEDISLGSISATTVSPGKTTGGGVINDGRANFGHVAKTTSGNLARGNLEFNDKLTQDNVHGNVDHASFATLPGSAKRGGTAEFSGSCTVKTPTNPSGSPCAGSFFVLVTDQDEPGAGKDTFTIMYCKTASTCQLRPTGDATILKGNIQVTLGTP